jgi:hypothetical protein
MTGFMRRLSQSRPRRRRPISVSRARILLTTGFAVLFAAAIGTLFLFLAHSRWREDLFPFFSDIIRDLGIALIVSSAVAVFIEIYRFVGHELGAMREVLDLVMSDKITPEVWLEVRELIENKKTIRKAVHIRVELSEVQELCQRHLSMLAVEYSYELYGLGKKPAKAMVAHELDYQFGGIWGTLPCFTGFNIDDGSATPAADDLNEANKTGKIVRDVWLSDREGSPIRVWLKRHELVPVPGSYNLYIPDFAKDLTVVVADVPKGVRVEVWIRPQGTGEELRQVGNMWHSDELMLPGQGIEIKFVTNSEGSGGQQQTDRAGA